MWLRGFVPQELGERNSASHFRCELFSSSTHIRQAIIIMLLRLLCEREFSCSHSLEGRWNRGRSFLIHRPCSIHAYRPAQILSFVEKSQVSVCNAASPLNWSSAELQKPFAVLHYLKDKAGVIPDFHYCQQIQWREEKPTMRQSISQYFQISLPCGAQSQAHLFLLT